MQGRPPKKTLSPAQERAASAFVEGAEAPGSGSGRSQAPQTQSPPEAAGAPPAASEPAASAARRGHRAAGERPWEAAYVREDVTKGYALRLPEPLYLKLKWVAAQTGRSVNTMVREAVETDVEAFLTDDAGRRR